MKNYYFILIGLLFASPLYPMGITMHYIVNGCTIGKYFDENFTLTSDDFSESMEFNSEDIQFEVYSHSGQDPLYVLTTQMEKEEFLVFLKTVESYLPGSMDSYINDIFTLQDNETTGQVQIISEKKEDIQICFGKLKDLMTHNKMSICGED